MSTAMVLLVGEQPAPNLLPTSFLKPDVAVLVYTAFTQHVAGNLEKLLTTQCRCLRCEVDAYRIPDIRSALGSFLYDKIGDYTLVFNLTGGTKPMAIAAYSMAHHNRASIVYFQTQGGQSLLYIYEISDDGQIYLKDEVSIPESITIDDYLTLYLSDYQTTGFARTREGEFERATSEALKPYVDEIIAGVKKGGALDIDLVLRCGNQVGIAEVKTGRKGRSKEGIDQLNTAGGRQFLGIYTRKFLIVDSIWDHTLSNLRELAEARNVNLIELPSYSQTGIISDGDKQVLLDRVQQTLRCGMKGDK